MRSFALEAFAAAAMFSASAQAVTNFTQDQMTAYLDQGGSDLARRYAPLWFFSELGDNLPCIPDWAFGGSPTTPDTYNNASQTPPAPQCEYPNVGCNCRNPGVPKNNSLPAWPVYYTYLQCNESEVRVAYNVFYQKDGAKVLGLINTGHDWDWERVIVAHQKNSDGTWQPGVAILSYHSGDKHIEWPDIQNTLSDEDYNAGYAINPNGLQDLDHPKVYVGWSKHPHFDTRNTGWVDPASQSLDNAYRGEDWWSAPSLDNYIRCDPSTACGQAMVQVNWGSATSNPVEVHDSLCSA